MRFEALTQQHKSTKKRITVTITEDTYESVCATAEEHGCTVSAAAAELLRYGCFCAAEMDKREAAKQQAEAEKRLRSQYNQ